MNDTERWQETVTDRGKPTILRITKGARQTVVSIEQLKGSRLRLPHSRITTALRARQQ